MNRFIDPVSGFNLSGLAVLVYFVKMELLRGRHCFSFMSPLADVNARDSRFIYKINEPTRGVVFAAVLFVQTPTLLER